MAPYFKRFCSVKHIDRSYTTRKSGKIISLVFELR